MYYYHPRTGQFDQSTRRSVRAQSYSLGTPRRSAYDDLYVPFTHIYHRPYDTSGSEYATRSEINRELIMSSAAMEDNYDITNKSRLRDKEVLAAANRAIVDTEIYSSPRSAVAARRATRGQSTPPMSSSTYSKTEAALIGSKMDTMLPGRIRQPRSSFAQAKMRQLRREKREDMQTPPAENTTSLRAHRPVHLSTYSKPIYDVQGVRKPNIMSWQYRLDALVSPDDLITEPRSLASVKSQLRDAHDKLDRHRQLMDRYLVTEKGFTVEDMRA